MGCEMNTARRVVRNIDLIHLVKRESERNLKKSAEKRHMGRVAWVYGSVKIGCSQPIDDGPTGEEDHCQRRSIRMNEIACLLVELCLGGL